MVAQWFYAVPNPSALMVQVYLVDRRSKGAYQLVSYKGQFYRLRLRKGVPASARQLIALGGHPPTPMKEVPVLPHPPTGPCLICGQRTTPDGVANAFWANTPNYVPAGFVCPVCEGPVVYL